MTAALRLYIANMNRGRGDSAEALECLDTLRGASAFPELRDLGYLGEINRVIWLIDSGQFEEAKQTLSPLSQDLGITEGTDRQLYIRLLAGELALKERKYSEAESLFQDAGAQVHSGSRAHLRELADAGLGIARWWLQRPHRSATPMVFRAGERWYRDYSLMSYWNGLQTLDSSSAPRAFQLMRRAQVAGRYRLPLQSAWMFIFEAELRARISSPSREFEQRARSRLGSLGLDRLAEIFEARLVRA